MNNYDTFLTDLHNQYKREIYVKITALTFQEHPTEVIEGFLTSGTINIDGDSAVRRSCNLTLTTSILNINDFYWGLKTKFKLEVGLKNDINLNYPEIIWFPQGIFVITSFNTNQSINNYTINIQGRDKICLLNGDLGGSMPFQVDLGVLEEYDSKTNITNYHKIPIKDIIKQSLITYAQEPIQNIIINDLDEVAVELLEYKGEQPLYLLRNINSNIFENYTPNGNTEAITSEGNIALKNFKEEWYDTRVNLGSEINNEAMEVYFSGLEDRKYTIGKIENGDAAGYKLTDLTYAGDLIIDIGESLTSGYDKIVKMLGNYEYFYNIEGQFVFQRKKNFINTIWNNEIASEDENYYTNMAYLSPLVYNFEDGEIIQSYQNNPNIQNLKNDYVIWGERITASGAAIPIHYRYAIGKKPEKYTNFNNKTFSIEEYDWRELIYQMALDYRLHGQEENFEWQLKELNSELYPTGKTGYEIYYIDLEGFWRQLYNPETNLEGFIPKGEKNQYWHENVIKRPEILNFWFDLLDSEGELSQYSVDIIGDRIKVLNDNSVKAIHYKEVPGLIFATQKDYLKLDSEQMSGYTLVQVQSDLETLFDISSQGKSAKNVLDELIYNHLYSSETITLKTLPIYYLQPNQRIYVKNEKSKIDGEYIITKMNYGFGHSGMMTINATKAPTHYL